METTLRYTQFGLQLVGIAERDHLDGSHRLDEASIEEVTDHLRDGSLFDWLVAYDLEDAVDLSMFQAEDRTTILEAFRGLANAVDADRKFGVREGGLNLLIAYCFECLQRQTIVEVGKIPDADRRLREIGVAKEEN